jgi:hypothetical protein
MIDYKCILFKEPVSLEPKTDLKIVVYGLLYPVKAGFNDDEIMDDVMHVAATQKWKKDGGYIENGFWIDKDGKRYPKEGDYIQRYINREYDNTGFEYAVGNVRLHPQNKCLIGNLMVDRALYNRIMQIIKLEAWVVAGGEKGDTK